MLVLCCFKHTHTKQTTTNRFNEHINKHTHTLYIYNVPTQMRTQKQTINNTYTAQTQTTQTHNDNTTHTKHTSAKHQHINNTK